MARLLAAFPRHDMSLETMTLYYERLNRFNFEQLTRACDLLIDNCEYFPTIAEIIGTIQRLPKPRPKLLDTPRPSQEEAGNVLRELKMFIGKSEQIDKQREQKRISERRAVLKKQAERLIKS